MSFNPLALTTAVCLFTGSILGAEEEKNPPRHVRFLPVGDAPPFRQEIRDGVRYELDAPPGSIPPREVVPGFGGGLALRLGQLSGAAEVPAGMAAMVLRRKDAAEDAVAWLKLAALPESGDFLVIVWRNADAKSWNAPRALIVPDGPLGHPAGMVRITNLFPVGIRIMWGDEALLVPASTFLRNVDAGAGVPLKILVADKAGGMKRYYSGTVTQNRGERGFITIYQADGVAPRRPLKVSMLREPVPDTAAAG